VHKDFRIKNIVFRGPPKQVDLNRFGKSGALVRVPISDGWPSIQDDFIRVDIKRILLAIDAILS
jgi:hypothetical protein